jgi:hypothetical protein
MFQLEHLSFMTAAFFRFNFTIVKHLENFRADWGDISARFGITARLDESQGLHAKTAVNHPTLQARDSGGVGGGSNSNSSAAAPVRDDVMHVHSRLEALFASKPEHLRAVCRILLIEYVCLPEYSLPAACQQAGMDITVQAQREVLTNCAPEIKSSSGGSKESGKAKRSAASPKAQ